MSATKKSKTTAKATKRQAASTKPKSKTAAKKLAPKKTAPKKAGAKKAAAKKATTKKAASKKLAPKKTVAKKAIAKKAAPKARAASPAKRAPAPKSPAASTKRRDAAGHLDPAYAADLRARIEEQNHERDSDEAFVGERSTDPLAKQLGEEFVETATTGEDEGEEVLDQRVPEESGGPFVVTTAGQEFAEGTDESNPLGAKREPFPRT